MNEIEGILRRAYWNTAGQIRDGLRVLPAAMEAAWEEIKAGYLASEQYSDTELFSMYNNCCRAAPLYSRYRQIGEGDAFSSLIVEMGVSHQSADWYRVMAHHYQQQALKVEDAGKFPE